MEVFCHIDKDKIKDPISFAKDFENFARREAEKLGIDIEVFQKIDYGMYLPQMLINTNTDNFDIAKELARKVKRLIIDLYHLDWGDMTCTIYPEGMEAEILFKYGGI